MDFKNWVGLDSFFSSVKRYVVSHAKMGKGGLVFSFPSYKSLISPSTPQPQQMPQQMALAAHVSHKGNLIPEIKDWENKQGTTKPEGAKKALISLSDPKWTGMQWRSFQSAINTDLAEFSSPLGFLFEVEIYLYLLKVKKLTDRDEDESVTAEEFMNRKKERYRAEILKAVKESPGKSETLFYMVEAHAKDLAEQIYNKSKQILKCVPAECMFTGGEEENFAAARRDPADIIIFCSQGQNKSKDRDAVGWNVKMTSDTKVHMMSATPRSSYQLLGGTDINNFEYEIQAAASAATEYDYRKNVSPVIVDALENIANQNFGEPEPNGNPPRFAKLMNDLISGKASKGRYDTFLAIRNYASPSMGGADWSKNIEKDFIATTDPRAHLKAKSNATVSVYVPPGRTYVRITYKVPGEGSFNGTSVFFEPKGSGQVTIKVTNLTSDRR